MSRRTGSRLTLFAGSLLYLLADASVHGLHDHHSHQHLSIPAHNACEDHGRAPEVGITHTCRRRPQCRSECLACKYLRTVQSVLPSDSALLLSQKSAPGIQLAATTLRAEATSKCPIRGPPAAA